MLSFKQYLAEAKNPDLGAFMKNAQLMLDKDILLFRGTESLKTDILLDGSEDTFTGFVGSERTIERRAKGSKLASRLATNWEIPNRKLSVFLTRDADHADNFGHLLLVIPADSVTQYGWSPTDFNQGPDKNFKRRLQTIETTIRGVFPEIADLNPDAEEDPIYKLLLKCLNSTGITQTELRDLANKQEDPNATKVADALIARADEFKKLIEESSSMFKRGLARAIVKMAEAVAALKMHSTAEVIGMASPKTFKLKTFSDLSEIPKKPASSDELWFNGKFLAINLDSRHTAYIDARKALKLLLKKD